MKKIREDLGIPLQAISQDTKLRGEQLEAIEADLRARFVSTRSHPIALLKRVFKQASSRFIVAGETPSARLFMSIN